MHTLKGVFSNPKPAKKNFIQENVRHLREMTNYWPVKEGDEIARGPFKANKFMNVPARVPLHITSGKSGIVKKMQPEVSDGLQSKARVIKPQPKTLVASKSSPSKTTKPAKQIRKIRNGVRTKNETDEVRLREGDVAEYVRRQRETVLSSQNQASGSDLSLEISDSDSIEYIKSPITFTRKSTVVAHRSTGCQTIDMNNMDSVFDEGIIRYPSAKASTTSKTTRDRRSVVVRNMSQQTERLQTPGRRSSSAKRWEAQSPTTLNTKSENISRLDGETNTEWADAQQHGGADFIRMNAKAVSTVPSRTPTHVADPSKPPSTYQRGIVPRYLQKRQSQWQKDEEKKVHDAPDPNCPPGHVPLPETERKETLKVLRKSYADLVHELNMLPVRSDTLRVRQRKMELEKQLNKLEEGIKVFSRPKVFVKIGA